MVAILSLELSGSNFYRKSKKICLFWLKQLVFSITILCGNFWVSYLIISKWRHVGNCEKNSSKIKQKNKIIINLKFLMEKFDIIFKKTIFMKAYNRAASRNL